MKNILCEIKCKIHVLESKVGRQERMKKIEVGMKEELEVHHVVIVT